MLNIHVLGICLLVPVIIASYLMLLEYIVYKTNNDLWGIIGFIAPFILGGILCLLL